jgi:hypothetical protein
MPAPLPEMSSSTSLSKKSVTPLPTTVPLPPSLTAVPNMYEPAT